jgi:predicted ABC-class ATPase
MDIFFPDFFINEKPAKEEKKEFSIYELKKEIDNIQKNWDKLSNSYKKSLIEFVYKEYLDKNLELIKNLNISFKQREILKTYLTELSEFILDKIEKENKEYQELVKNLIEKNLKENKKNFMTQEEFYAKLEDSLF